MKWSLKIKFTDNNGGSGSPFREAYPLLWLNTTLGKILFRMNINLQNEV